MRQPAQPRHARWKRIAGWIFGSLAAMVLLLVATVFILLHSNKFHVYLLRTAQARASEAFGSPVELRNFSVGWSNFGPDVVLYNVVIHGAPPYADTPLLTADQVSVNLTITSLWHRAWYVNDIQIQHPVVHIFADNQGHTNLPHSSSANTSASSGSSLDVFALGVRHLLLNQCEAYYNNEKSDLSANLHQLQFKLGFAPLENKYSGTLSYRDGQVRFQGSEPLPHELDAQFSATPQQFTLESAQLRSQDSRMSLEATVRDYSQPQAQATYQAAVDTGKFQAVLKNPSLPAGLIRLSGSINYQNEPGKTFLASTTVHGNLQSDALTIARPRAPLDIRDVKAKYALENGNAQVNGIHAELLGGTLDGNMTVQDLAGSSKSNLRATLKSISASAIQRLLGPSAGHYYSVNGSVNATADAAWGKTMGNLVASAEIKLAAEMKAAQSSQTEKSIPLNGLIHARYSAAKELLAFRQSYLRTPQTTVSLDGTASRSSSLQVSIKSNQMHELEEIAAAFRGPSATPLDLYGSTNLTATVSGSTQNPQVRGQVSTRDMRVRGTFWKQMHAQLIANPSSIQIENGELVAADKGHVAFQLNAGLRRWVFTDASKFQVHLSAADLQAGELAKAVGASGEVSGTLSANVQAQGTLLAPAGQGKIALTHGSVANEPVKAVNLSLQGNGDQLTARLQADLPAGTATADIQYQPKKQAYEVTVRATGIKLNQLETVKSRNLQLSGTLNLTATGRGTLQDPGLQAAVEIPKLAVRDQTINDVRLTADVANHVAKLNLTSLVLGTHADGHGTIRLTGDYPADITIDTQALPLQPILAMYAPAQAAHISGQTELHASLRGPLKNQAQWNGHIELPKLTLDYKDAIHLAAAGPIQADYQNGALDVKRFIIRGTGTDLTFQARLPAAKDALASMLLQGTIDLKLAELVSPDITSGGQLRLDINTYGQRANPNLQGQIHVVNASFAQAGTPLGLQDGNGTLTLTRDRLDITKFTGKVGGGTVTASGGLTYRPTLTFDMAMKAEGVRVLYAQSIRTTLDSNLALSGQSSDAVLRGQVNVTQLSFTSNFDLMEVSDQLGGGVAAPPPTGGFSDNLRLEVAIHTPGGISPSSRNLSMSGNANLELRGTASQPVMLGRINLNDGELIFRGNRYLIQAGTIEFLNPSRTQPVIDIAANTTINQYGIQMRLWGPVDQLHTNYSSDPALPPADIINLIAFGKTSEASAANPTPGSLGAESLIASQVSGQVTSRVEKLAGISQLSIDPVLGSDQQSPGARIAIQQRVSSKIFVTYSADVTSTQQQAIKLEYQLNRKASLSLVRDQNGGFSFETNFRKEW